jgi:Zn-dependent protease
VHEIAHGFMADWLGDPTARLQGRLTLNPIKHIDPVGSIIVPLITSLSGFTFGWAKPVQWNPYNVKDKRMGELLISIAGPASNILIALVFGLIIRLAGNSLSASFISISVYIVIINIVLAVFNLVPLPPLDGSKILFSILPSKYMWIREMLEAYSVFFFLLLIFFVWRFIEPVIPLLFKVIVG